MTAVAEHPAEPLVSVLIPAKDAAQWIPEQLAALDDQVDAPPFEVVIADNGSTDGTPQAALAGAHAFTCLLYTSPSPRD